jgi:hypothetical protein
MGMVKSRAFQVTDHRESFAKSPISQGDVPLLLTSFGFSVFLLPPTDGETSGFSYDWFSNDFYSAMKETGNEGVEFNDMLNLTFQSPMQFDQYSSDPVEARSWESQQNFQTDSSHG